MIELADLIKCHDLVNYKVHLASWNGEEHPLDVFVRDRDEWARWNAWRGKKDDFNRKFIFSLVEFYPENHVWLFGGIFRVKARANLIRDYAYDIELTSEHEELVGRLKVSFTRPGRAKALTFERYCEKMQVSEILREPYCGEAFCGFERINHTFSQLETIIRQQRSDWKAALMNIKGVYLVTDSSNGRKYVGSAYGDSGIWSRWSCYTETGHGWSDELCELIATNGIQHARDHFRIVLLEHRPMRTDDGAILEREAFWKQALLSRLPHGYNKN